MSSGALARLNVILAFAGLFIASMLSLSHFMDIQLPCGIGSGCDLVTQDSRSQLLGIPFAYYGLFGYVVITTIALTRVFSPAYKPSTMHALGYGLSFIGLLISIGLTVFSVRSIHALCTWCIASAVTMSLLFMTHALGAMKEKTVVSRRELSLDALWVVVLACALLAGLTTAASNLKSTEAETIQVNRGTLKELSTDDLLPPDAHVTGPTSAKATVVMFGDLTCPVCREAYQSITSLMQRRHDFRLAFRQLPLTFHPLARPAALISEMAAENGRFWDFADACYDGYPGSVDELIKIGVGLGLDEKTVRRRLRDPNDKVVDILDRDATIEAKLGLHSTPSVFILIDGYYPEPIVYRGIEKMLDHNTAIKKGPTGKKKNIV